MGCPHFLIKAPMQHARQHCCLYSDFSVFQVLRIKERPFWQQPKLSRCCQHLHSQHFCSFSCELPAKVNTWKGGKCVLGQHTSRLTNFCKATSFFVVAVVPRDYSHVCSHCARLTNNHRFIPASRWASEHLTQLPPLSAKCYTAGSASVTAQALLWRRYGRYREPPHSCLTKLRHSQQVMNLSSDRWQSSGKWNRRFCGLQTTHITLEMLGPSTDEWDFESFSTNINTERSLPM